MSLPTPQPGLVMADRQRFTLDADRWTAFMEALDAPPRALPRLERLFRAPTPFDPAPPST